MLVYRIGKTKYARDITGEGARINGGRWNHIGTPCCYSSESRALALLEYTVNVNIDDIPRALSITTFDIPARAIHTIKISELPGDWKQDPAPASTCDFGTQLLQTLKHLIIRFPSVIIPNEWNYIINPLHADRSLIKIVDTADFVYDLRIKRK